MNSKERLEQILLHLKLSANKLSKEIGHSSNVKIHHVKSGRNEISEEIAKDIEKYFPEFNYEWIVSGKGSMLKNSECNSGNKFANLSVEAKLDKLFEQNLQILEEYSEIKKAINKSSLDNQDHKNIIVDYIDLSLQPILEYIGATTKQKENK